MCFEFGDISEPFVLGLSRFASIPRLELWKQNIIQGNVRFTSIFVSYLSVLSSISDNRYFIVPLFG